MTFRYRTLPGYARMQVRPEDLQWWTDSHDRYRWTFAKTMPHVPHSWIWRGRQIPPEEYDRVFGAVRTFGEPGKYWDRTQLYLHNRERGTRYWLMDRHYYTCLILNMADDGKEYGRQDAPSTVNGIWSDYDAIAPWWDDVYRDFEALDSTALWGTVHRNVAVARPSLLDIGAGTGGTLDAKVAPSQRTTVVDPSQGMLNDLVLKYPQVGRVFPATFADYLASGEAHEHDLVVASLGSASYLDPQEVKAAPTLARRLTVLSFYGQVPAHRLELPDTHGEALAAALTLPGAVGMHHGSFVHVVVRP